MPKIPKCLKPRIWELVIQELDRLEIQPIPSFKELELRKFVESLVE